MRGTETLRFTVHDPSVPVDAREANRLADLIWADAGRRLRVDVRVVGDAEIARLHESALSDPGVTDVITFDLAGGGPGEPCEDDVDGEVVVNAALAGREAQARGHEPETELLFYVAHGLLHLLGYDDRTAPEREEMLRLQAGYLRSLGRRLEA